MATIKHYPFFSRLRAESTMYVQHLGSGRSKHSGRAISFWFRPATAALAEVPLDDREQTLVVSARTVDFQIVSVQATVNYRVSDPELCLARINFGIDPRTGLWREAPLELLGGLLIQIASQPMLSIIAGLPLREALTMDIEALRARLLAAVGADERLLERGLMIIDLRIASIRADRELERALQTETREQMQQEADKATYERRAVAVERERAIAENELQNKIELAAREHDLATRQGRTERERVSEAAAAAKITADAEAERAIVRAQSQAREVELLGQAKAEAEAARLASYQGVDRAVLFALTAERLAGKLPEVKQLTITPDLVSQALTAFSGVTR